MSNVFDVLKERLHSPSICLFPKNEGDAPEIAPKSVNVNSLSAVRKGGPSRVESGTAFANLDSLTIMVGFGRFPPGVWHRVTPEFLSYLQRKLDLAFDRLREDKLCESIAFYENLLDVSGLEPADEVPEGFELSVPESPTVLAKMFDRQARRKKSWRFRDVET